MLYNRFTAGILITFLILFSIVSKSGASEIVSDEVILFSNDGTLEITGDLLSYENNIYSIETKLGNILISGNVVRCHGNICPPVDIIENTGPFAEFDPKSMQTYGLYYQMREVQSGQFRLVSD